MHVRQIALVVALLFGFVGVAEAGKASKVERKFGGQILFSDKKFPTSAKSESQYISKLQKQKKAKFWENKAKQEWKVHFAAFFKKPLGDLEYTVKLYDISGGQQLLSSFEQYTDSSDQRSLLSYIVLDRKSFGVNKRILMTIEVRGRVVAAGRFMMLGEAERYTGKADFSEEEAAGGVQE